MSHGSDRQNGPKTTIVLLGSNEKQKQATANQIIPSSCDSKKIGQCKLYENEKLKVIITPDLYDETSPDQNVIDCMALSYPGPQVVLLVVEGGEGEEQIHRGTEKIKELYGEEIAGKTEVLITNRDNKQGRTCHQNVLSFRNLDNLKEKWSEKTLPPLNFCFQHYTEELVERRKNTLMMNNGRNQMSRDLLTEQPPNQRRRKDPSSTSYQNQGHWGPETWRSDTLNLVLLGQTGTGKSMSGNTILNNNSFPSHPSSVPVTTECKAVSCIIHGTKVTVVDTPDFFNEDLRGADKQLFDCREMCQRGSCVYLLVMYVGRFTDGERDILENLERAFEREIRDDMIVLFTHGEKLKQSNLTEEQFVKEADSALQKIVQACGNRFHVFANGKRVSQQVVQLFEKIRGMPVVSDLGLAEDKTGTQCTVS